MPVAIDSNVLLYLLNPKTRPPTDKKTGNPVDYCQERVAYLIECLSRASETVIIPTPVISEVLTRAGEAAPKYLEILDKQKSIKIVPFDQRAAIETSLILRKNLPYPSGGDPRVKMKFDIMIFATAKVYSASKIYSDDGDMKHLGEKYHIPVLGIADISLPSDLSQLNMF